MPRQLTSTRPIRCAIYARKSVATYPEDHLGSIHVQREICSAYIRSQRHRAWTEIPTPFEDEGFSGGNLNRPALSDLLSAVEQGLVDVIVIYKLDRLTRSLSDFIRLIDLLDQYEVTFVSVTQSFDTQDSVGRLVLNILLTFAQFEREMLSDRIRDKMHALRRAGRWVGGAAPYGYDMIDRRLVINEAEAEVVRLIHRRYLELGSSNKVTKEMRNLGIRSKTFTTKKGHQHEGHPAHSTFIYGIIGNPTYLGEYHVDGEIIKALHDPIIDRDTWGKVTALKETCRYKKQPSSPHRHLLLGILFDEFGRQMTVWAGKNAEHTPELRYYLSTSNHRLSKSGVKALRAEANDLEELIKAAICSFFRTRSKVSQAIHMLGYRDANTDKLIDRGDIAARHIDTFDRRRLRRAWEALIERIELSRERIHVMLRCEQVRAFLAWPGTGLFKLTATYDAKYHHVYVLETEAFAVRSERQFRLPIDTSTSPGKPKRGLVDLMSFARRAQALVYEDRTLTFKEIAHRLHRREAFVMRALRLNYLAPDIISAIVDGRHPPDLTRRKLLTSSIPMDWVQQRVLFGFPARHDPRANDEHY